MLPLDQRPWCSPLIRLLPHPHDYGQSILLLHGSGFALLTRGSRIPIAWHWPPSSYEAIAALLFYITIVTNLTLCLQAYWAEFTMIKYTNIKEAE